MGCRYFTKTRDTLCLKIFNKGREFSAICWLVRLTHWSKKIHQRFRIFSLSPSACVLNKTLQTELYSRLCSRTNDFHISMLDLQTQQFRKPSCINEWKKWWLCCGAPMITQQQTNTNVCNHLPWSILPHSFFCPPPLFRKQCDSSSFKNVSFHCTLKFIFPSCAWDFQLRPVRRTWSRQSSGGGDYRQRLWEVRAGTLKLAQVGEQTWSGGASLKAAKVITIAGQTSVVVREGKKGRKKKNNSRCRVSALFLFAHFWRISPLRLLCAACTPIIAS